MKKDKAAVTLHFIHLVYSRFIPSTPQVMATKNCLSIYILQTCSRNFYYLHAPVLWLSKWHPAVHHRPWCWIKGVSESQVLRLLNICSCLKIWDKCILFPSSLGDSVQGQRILTNYTLANVFYNTMARICLQLKQGKIFFFTFWAFFGPNITWKKGNLKKKKAQGDFWIVHDLS